MQCDCRQCSASFEITPDDLAFYDKVSPVFAGKKELIPPPTLCPECRKQRRLSWFNIMRLYRRVCHKSGRSILSHYSDDKPHRVYASDVWWQDDWDQCASALEWDDHQTLSQQYAILLLRAPLPNLFAQPEADENSEYTNFALYNKNCYLIFHANYCEDCMYGFGIKYCKNSVDVHSTFSCELLYDCIDCEHCYHLTHCQDCEECSESAYLTDCIGCRNCLACFGLRNKEYHIENIAVPPAEFHRVMETLHKGSHSLHCAWLKRVHDIAMNQPHIYVTQRQCEDCSGDHLFRCQNVRDSFDVKDTRDSRYIERVFNGPNTDIYDTNQFGMRSELLYENACVGFDANNVHFSTMCRNSIHAMYYCYNCEASSHLFACVGLKHKQYCILNKQYTKEEYETLVPKIIEKMRADGEWGEFFPVTMSPFAYNETVAQEYFPMTKEEVLARGWKWRDQTDDMPKVDKIIPAAQLPDSIDDIPDDILNWAIECEATKRPFKIIKQELEFYRNMRLPVPRFHPDERHRRRMALRNPRKLWKRECQKCGKDIETSYAPDRPEIVYCEACYLQEVY